MKFFLLYLFLFGILFFAKGQNINMAINTDFTSSTEISPFHNINHIYGINITGNIHLYSDTSLIRVILSDSSSKQYLITEAYPILFSDSSFSFRHLCDETCVLDKTIPNSIIIEVLNAEIYIDSIEIDTTYKSNIPYLKSTALNLRNSQKIDSINAHIQLQKGSWVAGTTEFSELSYEDKKAYFGGIVPNLQGVEYYVAGYFAFGDIDNITVSDDIVKEFDWRNRHAADIPNTFYYNSEGFGWIPPRRQGQGHADCWAFAPVYTLESLLNLYFNNQINCDLSESNVISCSGGGSTEHGGSTITAIAYLKNNGIVNEDCFPYNTSDPPCSNMCSTPIEKIKINDYSLNPTINPTIQNNQLQYVLKYDLINKGPLVTVIWPWRHSMSLVGYGIIKEGDLIMRGHTGDSVDSHTQYYIPSGSPAIGKPYYIFKQSWGGWGINGDSPFINVILDVNNNSYPTGFRFYSIQTPLTSLVFAETDRRCEDSDQDGYYFWGIGEKPATCPECPDEEDCDDSKSYLGPYDEKYNCSLICDNFNFIDNLSTNAENGDIWNDKTYFNNILIIDSGVTLTILGTVYFSENASIIINPGGKLILDGSVLTTICDEDVWQGIQLLGNSSISQLTSGAQGTVELKNGAVISNAVCGIKVWDGTNANSSGGIVRAENASFLNNATAVEFGEYHNMNNGYELGNRSYFTNCNFTINNDYLSNNELFQAHVKLNSIKNVSFAGCTFSNERNIPPSVTAERTVSNVGILAFNSGFSVKPFCNVSGIYPCPPEQQNRSAFKGFSYGIYAAGSEGNYTVNVDQTDFDNNVIGINLSAVNSASVLSSQFKIGYADLLPKQTGIIAYNSTGFRFEENQFVGNTEFSGTSVGIKIRDSGTNNNQTYKNEFSNLTIGEEFIGMNRSNRDSYIGLQALCNNHNDITNSDILVEMNENGIYDGIRYYQGGRDDGTTSYFLSAGNLFSNSATTNYDNNTMQYIDYQYSANDPREEPTVNNMVYLDFPAVSNNCPSRIDALTLSQISQQYSAAEISYLSLLYNYNQQIDGGNTEQLLDDIQGKWSDDVWKIRQELIAKSPYVSQEVLIETAKQNLLPQAIYLEICLANVDATRSESFLKFLQYEIPNPLPEYMIDIIRENWDTKSLRTVLESNLAHYSGKKDNLLDMMLNNSLKDSIVNRSYVRSMLTERGYYSDYFTIAEGYIEENDFENAYNILYDLSLNYYKLTKEQETEINDFEEYIAFRENLFASDSSNIYQLTASEIENLLDYTETHTGRGRILAQNILCVLYDICPEEELLENKDHFIPNPDTYSSAKNPSNQIEVMPNPAQNYTTFKWNFDLIQGNAVLKIYEQSGKQIETQVLFSSQGQWVWDTRGVSNGIYTYSVTSNSILLGSGKVVVKK